METDHIRLQVLLKDTITILCRNSVQFGKELKVQGLLGITADDENILIVHINESYVAGYEASVCDQSNDLDFNIEELPDSATESIQRELCEDDTWKQKYQNFEKEGSDSTHEIGRNNLNTVYMTDCEEFDESSFFQNVHKEKTRRLSRNSDNFIGKMALKQKSKGGKMSNLHPIRQPLGCAAKKSSLNKTEERTWTSDLSNGSLQASNVIKIEPAIKSENEFTQTYINQSGFSDPEMTFDDDQSATFSSLNNPDYKPRRHTQSFQFSRPSRSIGRSSNIWKVCAGIMSDAIYIFNK